MNELTGMEMWVALSPVLILLSAGTLQVLVEALRYPTFRKVANTVISVAALGAALVVLVYRYRNTGSFTLAKGMLWENPWVIAFQGVLLVVALLAVLVVISRLWDKDGSFAAQASHRPGSAKEAYATRVGYQRTEVLPLLVFSTAGMMIFIGSQSLLMLFVGLELMSLPLYVMAAMGRRRRLLSQEAGFKYFLLGSYASAFFLMGIAMLYGYAGTLNMIDILRVAGQHMQIAASAGQAGPISWLLVFGLVLMLVGLFFKIGAVPFHAWSPDVYQGAPSPITGFMAAGVKIAVFGFMISVSYVLFGLFLPAPFMLLIAIIAVATMVVGTFSGIMQTDVKRMLAYSSMAHVGFVLIAFYAIPSQVAIQNPATYTAPMSAVLFYLLSYGIATVGAFALVSIVREKDREAGVLGEASALDRWRGLGKTNPVLAVSMLIFLLSFAGIPLTGGFVGKLVVFVSGVQSGGLWLVVIAVLASAITAFFYFRLVRIMFFEDADDRVDITTGAVLTKAVVVLAAGVTVVLGLVPGPVLTLLNLVG